MYSSNNRTSILWVVTILFSFGVSTVFSQVLAKDSEQLLVPAGINEVRIMLGLPIIATEPLSSGDTSGKPHKPHPTPKPKPKPKTPHQHHSANWEPVMVLAPVIEEIRLQFPQDFGSTSSHHHSHTKPPPRSWIRQWSIRRPSWIHR